MTTTTKNIQDPELLNFQNNKIWCEIQMIRNGLRFLTYLIFVPQFSMFLDPSITIFSIFSGEWRMKRRATKRYISLLYVAYAIAIQ